ncbi:hypothetical protein QJS10_CPA06g00590 [Acorus calamus]|uniref:Uncharacterized protein n=1 Tax=Acorus calamus TaxID=4465 RepID=A0AAV9EMA3_ACOCL|nr:hypothetical protein QJS10_CPA06g00590 [Acorus calamus]
MSSLGVSYAEIYVAKKMCKENVKKREEQERSVDNEDQRKPGRRWFSSVVKKKVHPGSCSATTDEAGSSTG